MQLPAQQLEAAVQTALPRHSHSGWWLADRRGGCPGWVAGCGSARALVGGGEFGGRALNPTILRPPPPCPGVGGVSLSAAPLA